MAWVRCTIERRRSDGSRSRCCSTRPRTPSRPGHGRLWCSLRPRPGRVQWNCQGQKGRPRTAGTRPPCPIRSASWLTLQVVCVQVAYDHRMAHAVRERELLAQFAVKVAVAGAQAAVLLVEEGDTGLGRPVAQAARPVLVHQPVMRPGFAADDYPLELVSDLEVRAVMQAPVARQVQRPQEGFAGQEADVG